MISSIRGRVGAPDVLDLTAKRLERLLHGWTALSLFTETLFLQTLFVFFSERFVVGARVLNEDANARFLTGHFAAGVCEKLRVLGFGERRAQVTRLRRELDVEFSLFEHGGLRSIKRRDEQHLLLPL